MGIFPGSIAFMNFTLSPKHLPFEIQYLKSNILHHKTFSTKNENSTFHILSFGFANNNKYSRLYTSVGTK